MTRTSAEIGAGIAAARDARRIPAGERIHIIGVAGAGASAAALLAHHSGATVSGCDRGGPSPYTVGLQAIEGLHLAWEHSPSHIAGGGPPLVDRIAVTKALTSVDPDHVELAAARSAGVPVEAWQQVVADVAAGARQRLVAVAGTHGKSTSSGWLVHVLTRAGRDPSAFVGALLPAALTDGIASTARWGAGTDFVVEADEYAGNFDPFRPEVAILLNAEWDHPDVFADDQAVLDAFRAWLGAPGVAERTIVANVGDPGVREVLRALRGVPGRTVAVALSGGAGGPGGWGALDLSGSLAGDGSLILGGPMLAGASSIAVSLPLPGQHNAANALCVAAAAAVLGISDQAVAQGLSTFEGVGRRLELKGEVDGVVVLDDYGHHPTAIGATLEAVRARYPGRRVWAVYEPLTYHRTAAMLEAFAQVLSRADRAVVADIWAGRDRDTTITSASELAAAISGQGDTPAVAPGSVEATADHLATRVRTGDVVLVMGGGRSYVIADRLVEHLLGRSPRPSSLDAASSAEH